MDQFLAGFLGELEKDAGWKDNARAAVLGSLAGLSFGAAGVGATAVAVRSHRLYERAKGAIAAPSARETIEKVVPPVQRTIEKVIPPKSKIREDLHPFFRDRLRAIEKEHPGRLEGFVEGVDNAIKAKPAGAGPGKK